MKDMNVDESSDKKKQKRGGKAAVKAKKKSVTHITGLLTYEIDLKKTAKLFGGKFACGTSSNEKADEIVIQGDFIDQVIDILEEKFPQIPSDKIKDLGDIK